MRSAVPHVAAIAVIAACAWLAIWQIERAGEKREILDRWHNRAPADLATLAPPYDVPQPVEALGIWVENRQLLIDNRVRDQRTGVQVLTPLRLPDGRVFLVNRGWAPWPARTAELPDPAVPTSETEIRGVLNSPPGTGVRLGEAEVQLDRDWPVLVTYFEYDVLTRLYGERLQQSVIQLDPEHPAHLTGDAWKVVTFGPDRHIGYAMTWTSIAVVVATIWLVLTLRQRQRKR